MSGVRTGGEVRELFQHTQAHKKTRSEVEGKDPEREVIQAGTGPHPDNKNSPDHQIGPGSPALSQLRSSDRRAVIQETGEIWERP